MAEPLDDASERRLTWLCDKLRDLAREAQNAGRRREAAVQVVAAPDGTYSHDAIRLERRAP